MINLNDIQQAQARIAPYLRRTETVRSQTLSQRLGTNVYLKLELFQKTGSFKPRAAFNKMLLLNEEQRRAGTVAVSGGNFAQGVAYAGRTLGLQTTIFMPAYTPQNYLDATRAYGARVELRPDIQSAFDGADMLRQEGLAFLHPYDDPEIMAGSGGIGLEILEQVPAVTDVFVSVGGGGLMSGVTMALKSLKPEVRVWSVETEGAAALGKALEAGQPVRLVPTSLAKTLGAPVIAADALAIAQQYVTRHTLVTDEEAYRAERFLLERTKILTELSASCTLAAAEKLRKSTSGENFTPESHVVLILCGGNVSLEDLVGYKSKFEG
jgi:threonine dehydratase